MAFSEDTLTGGPGLPATLLATYSMGSKLCLSCDPQRALGMLKEKAVEFFRLLA